MIEYSNTQYHPRYGRSEYLTYEARERGRRRRAIAGLFLAPTCAGLIVYLVR
jgi:hypothetical protein